MTKIQIRRDTSSNWQQYNPVPAQGEPCYETDTGKLKIGNGNTPYNSLPYIGNNSSGGGDSADITDLYQLQYGTESGSIPVTFSGNNITLKSGILITTPNGTFSYTSDITYQYTFESERTIFAYKDGSDESYYNMLAVYYGGSQPATNPQGQIAWFDNNVWKMISSTGEITTFSTQLITPIAKVYLDGQTVKSIDYGSFYKISTGATDAYTKAETDELLDNKQDILTPVQPLTVQNKIISNLVGFTYATEDTIKADTATSVLFYGGNYQENYKAIGSGANPPTSYVAIPYSLGDVIGVPTERATQLLFGKFIGDDFYAVISGFLTQAYTTRNIPPLAFLETQPIPTTQEGNWGGINTTSSSTFTDNYPELNRISYIQITQTGSSANIGVWWVASSSGNYYYTYDATATNAQVSSNLINEIDTVLFLSSNTTTTYPVSSFSRRACGVKKTVDINTLKNDILVNYPNIFDISSAEHKNYLEVQVDGTTITTNSSGQLQANIPSNLTTQGNTFNGAGQLVQLDSSGKLPAIDGSQLTGISAGSNSLNAIVMEQNNFNNYIKAGVYYWSSYTTPVNHPNGNYKGMLQVFVQEDGNSPVVQIFTLGEALGTDTPPGMWIRYCNSGRGTGYQWSSWLKVNGGDAPTNMVTTDTEQTITGRKFINDLQVSGAGGIKDDRGVPFIQTSQIDGVWNWVLGSNDSTNFKDIYVRRNTSGEHINIDSGNISNYLSTGGLKYWTGTETDYTAIETKNADTLYRTTDTNKVYLGSIALGGSSFVSLTQAQYDSLETKDTNTMYVITD